jgi:hypothetical protein
MKEQLLQNHVSPPSGLYGAEPFPALHGVSSINQGYRENTSGALRSGTSFSAARNTA